MGAYDVDQTKFAMQRSRECFINNAEVSSHDFYFKHILKIDNFAKTTKSFGLNEISEKVPVEALGQKIELNLKKNYQRNKNSILKELKKKELSLKLLNNYDANFWDRFLEGIRSTKEHIRKIRACSNNLGYSEVGKLSQILKNNML